VKKCMEYELEGARPKDKPKKTWREIVEKDCHALKLNKLLLLLLFSFKASAYTTLANL